MGDAALPGLDRLIDSLAVKDESFRKDLIRQCDQNIEMIKLARGLSPFDRELRDDVDRWLWKAAWYQFVVPETAANERERKRRMAKLEQTNPEESATTVSSAGKAASPAGKNSSPAGKAASDDAKKLRDKVSIDSKLAKLDQEEKDNWATERQYWLRGLKRLSGAVKQYPCNEVLKRKLEVAYHQARGLAEQRQDVAALDELKGYSTGLLQ